jgi:hypothetical protein
MEKREKTAEATLSASTQLRERGPGNPMRKADMSSVL